MSRPGDSLLSLWHGYSALASRQRGSVAVRAGQRTLTFGEIHTSAERFARAFERAGLDGGVLVGLILPSGPRFVCAFLALCAQACKIALISPKYRAAEIEAIVEHLRPAALVTDGAFLRGLGDRFSFVTTDAGGLVEDTEPVLAARFPSALDGGDERSAAADDLIRRAGLLKLTSGSTGESKAVALSVENLLAEADNVSSTLGLTGEDHIVAAAPLFHSYAFDLGLLPLIRNGSRLTLHDAFVPRRVLADLSDPASTTFLGVPAVYRFLMDAEPPGTVSLRHLRYALSCTAPLPASTLTGFADSFGIPICDHYGSSETGAITTHVSGEVLRRPTSVGQPMKNVEISIVDEEGRPQPAGTMGEVVARSGAVALGYCMGGPPGRSPFAADGFHTGDLGELDADGYLYLRGRRDELINVGGLKVSPSEVRQVLESHPAVREVAVAAARDPAGEQFVYVVTTLRWPTSEEDLLAYCRERMAEYKVPRRIDVRDEIPRGPTGKVQIRPEEMRG
jgi:acyl-CoA synthetase (AMP-forming)/AMP-acid ligase II